MPKKILAIIIIVALGILVVVTIKPKLAQSPSTLTLNPQPSITYNLQPTTLFFAGDIMLSRNVARKIYESGDFSLPFEKVKNEIKQADISFANLESPFSDQGNHAVENSLVFNADPKSIQGLLTAGFDVLSTANNHAFDQGLKGITYTLDLLEKNGIIPVGTTRDGESASIWPNAHMIEKNGTTFGFLSYSYAAHNSGSGNSDSHVLDFNHPENLTSHISTMKDKGADVVIVNIHAGTEYTRTPTESQIAFAHAAIDAGADLVIGEHPHWIQTVEQYQGKWIFYSLGNFVFDQMWSTETRQGLTLFVTYENTNITKVELKPLIIDNYSTPRWANEEETKEILEKINLTSPMLLDKNE